ncbi:MAG: GGDEF domain-containing protein [Rhizorhabdus sp.]|uniref:GGDEF domain-containing protein n=1 Tax=Rhizorhabdus sp. TaxID=1968843 RepID=UPI001B45D50D|nr:GGDEF domain-containing protein [Rhizorhabdus sp.]MBP8232576.1 GGDEF domain-containing protein [Rhizorhabdus sp.]
MSTLPDVETLRLCSMLASTAFGLAFALLWWRDRGAGHMLYWAASSFLYALTIIGFGIAGQEAFGLTSLLFAGLVLSNVLGVSGVLSLEGRSPFRPWMIIPLVAAPILHGLPRLAVATGHLPPGSVLPQVGDAVGLSLSMALVGCAFLFGRTAYRTAGHRIVGCAQLAYVPAYALSVAGEFGALHGIELLALLGMLSDQLLLGILNMGLLSIPIERAQRDLRQVALRDALTGAWNRAGLREQMVRLIEPGASVLVLDIDHFKAINDRHGHAAGDAILALIGREAAVFALEKGGELARLGGDEFAILLPAACDDALGFAEGLRAQLSRKTAIAHDWSVSMGLAAVQLGESDFDAALHRADISLYRAKAHGRGRVAA